MGDRMGLFHLPDAFVSRDFKSGNTLREEEVALNNPG